MEDSSRLIFIGVGILVVGLIIGYSIGRSRSTREKGKARSQLTAQRHKTSEARRDATRCEKKLASKPALGPDEVAQGRTQALLRLTEAELAIRNENAGIARTRMSAAVTLLGRLATGVTASTAEKLRGFSHRLQKLRESTLRMDPRDPKAVDQVASKLQALRNSVAYLPLDPRALPSPRP